MHWLACLGLLLLPGRQPADKASIPVGGWILRFALDSGVSVLLTEVQGAAAVGLQGTPPALAAQWSLLTE